jgi:hypothetical protein
MHSVLYSSPPLLPDQLADPCDAGHVLTARNQHFASFRSPSLFYLPAHSRCRGCLLVLDHTQAHTTVGRTPLDEGSARRRDLYLTTQTLYKRQTPMPPERFEPTIPASARPQTYALARAATGIGPQHLQGHSLRCVASGCCPLIGSDFPHSLPDLRTLRQQGHAHNCVKKF